MFVASACRKLAVAVAAAAATGSVLFTGGTASATEGACTTLYPPTGGSASVCKYYSSNGDGTYDGSWKINSTTSGVTVKGYFDGVVGTLSPSGPFYDVAEFYMSACKSGRCGGWW